MFRRCLLSLLACACALVLLPAAQAAAGADFTLTPAQALSIAARLDAGRAVPAARALAWREDAVADAQLPDPELVFGLDNVPLDSPSLRDDDMTMAAIGLMQRFPPAGERAARRAGTLAQAGAQDARADGRELDVRRAVRTAYLEVALAQAREALAETALRTAQEAEALTRAAYAGGQGGQAAVIEAGLDALRMHDRAQAAAGQRQEARAALARWLGADASRPLPQGLPSAQALAGAGDGADSDADTLVDADTISDAGVGTMADTGAYPTTKTAPPAGAIPATHPALALRDADIARARGAVALARSAYHPALALEGRYGLRRAADERGRNLPDMGSVMATVSLPLLPGARQDRRLAAARARLAAARHARVDEQRVLVARLDATRARLAQLTARLTLYDTQLLVRADTLTASARAAVQAGTGTPAAAARARLAATELALERLDLAGRALRAHIEIAWLEGR